MSAVTIIKNIFEFAKILNSASRVDVNRWNIASIQNAISWSDYCQEIYRCVKDKDYEEDLNQQLSQIALFLQPVSCISLSVESLAKAKYLLVETLLSNPNFPVPSKSFLCDIILANPESAWILQKFEDRSARLKLRLETCVEILNLTEASSQYGNGVDKLYAQKVLYEARTLNQHLYNICCRTNKPERFKKYCQSMCDKLSESQEGWAVIVSMFCKKQNLSLTEYDKLKDVQSLILDWLKFKLDQDIAKSILWELNADMLFQASCDNQNFFQWYLSSLVLWADTFRPIINSERKFIWRSPTGYSTEILTEHFKKFFLILSPLMEDRKTKVLETVVQKVKSTDFTVWQVVAQILLQILK